ncbi:uncharacterized protein LOC142900094 [Nelusetta ayraudi]|uniref:uncharacterized protein LOC142900094 n=1 Tax=Nelusetta ayraudi TaxID=303726 RepID=UPI003F72F4C4
MSSPGRPPAGEGMYSHLLDEDGTFTIEPAVGVRPGFRPVRPLAVAQPYCLATFCLVALSAALLVAVIIVTAQHQKNQPQGGAEESSSSSSALQTQGQNVSTLVASIKKLQQEKQQLQQEKQQLQQDKQEKQQLQQDKQQSQQEKQQLQQEKQQLQQEKQQLQQEKQQSQQEKQQLQQDKQQLQQEKQQLQQEKQQLQQEKQQLQQDKQQLQQEKQQLQQEKAELLSRLSATKGPEVIGQQSSGPPPTLLPCPDGWHTFNSSCYMVSKTSKSWSGSKDDCSSKGGHLAIITTAEEQSFVWNLLPRGHWNAFWFGITDQDTEDQWTWVDGTPLVGGFWEVGEPNNHIDEDCGYIVKTRVLSRVAIRSWYDAPCSMDRRFICELERGGGANSAATTTSPH